jgi:hypothetical protein
LSLILPQTFGLSAGYTSHFRYVVEKAPGGGGAKEYEVVLNIPPGIQCERCVLQWYYQTANSREVNRVVLVCVEATN